MIVVGILAPGDPRSASVIEVARRAAATGARTEIVGVAPLGAEGDRGLVGFAAEGIGHATVTRSTANGIEQADLDLALRYLPDIRVIVLFRPTGPLLATGLSAASWSGATLIVIGPLGADATAHLTPTPGDARAPGGPEAPGTIGSGPILLDPAGGDREGSFAGVVAALAVRLEAGDDPGAAWKETVAALALDRA